jgi:hypothetical protein
MNNTFQNTNYYNDIMKAYDAGIKNDTTSRDNLIKNLSNALSDSCKTYTSNPNVVSNVGRTSGTIPYIDLEHYFGKYRNDIEFQNSLKEQLLADEETYFVNKYGAVVYKYLTDRRASLFSQLNASTSVSRSQTSQSSCSQLPSGRSQISNRITNTNNTPISGYYDENGLFVESSTLCSDNALSFYNMFSKYLPYSEADATNRKIEYRETEHDFLMKINSIMNIIYYILFVIMIFLLIGGNNLQLKERFPIYLILLFLPFLYPYIFKLIYYTYNYITESKNIHGPKNAFLDSNGESNFIDAYNN